MGLTLTAEAAWGVVETASQCGDHPIPGLNFTKEDIEKVFYFDGGCGCGLDSEGKNCGSWCDTWSEALFRLKDGRYVRAHEDSDSSGHG